MTQNFAICELIRAGFHIRAVQRPAYLQLRGPFVFPYTEMSPKKLTYRGFLCQNEKFRGNKNYFFRHSGPNVPPSDESPVFPRPRRRFIQNCPRSRICGLFWKERARLTVRHFRNSPHRQTRGRFRKNAQLFPSVIFQYSPHGRMTRAVLETEDISKGTQFPKQPAMAQSCTRMGCARRLVASGEGTSLLRTCMASAHARRAPTWQRR